MKATDFIVQTLAAAGVKHAFGYPGGMVTHLMNSLNTYRDFITAHVAYHEQAAAFMACGCAQASGCIGFAYATSGPGATNLVTGIAHAYYDSIPVLFLTGNVNTFESKGALPLRQRGFQEMDVIALVSGVTKYCAAINNADDLPEALQRAIFIAQDGRPGPVLLDIPMDVQRSEIGQNLFAEHFAQDEPLPACSNTDRFLELNGAVETIFNALKESRRPLLLLGAGIHQSRTERSIASLLKVLSIPVVSSMPAIDLAADYPDNYGFIGTYGNRCANTILTKCDLLITFGTRLDGRQTGSTSKSSEFAKDAKLIRIDIDESEFSRNVSFYELDLLADLRVLLPLLVAEATAKQDELSDYSQWLFACKKAQRILESIDKNIPNSVIKIVSMFIDPRYTVTTDVGQNQVWVAQSYQARGQRVLFSAGHGSMGHALPAAIGAYYATGRPVVAFCGDGGFQMNIQELQFIAREQLPIKIIVLNNSSLGMIRHFQEQYFDSTFTQTTFQGGWANPDFTSIAQAYGLEGNSVNALELPSSSYWDKFFQATNPALLEIVFPSQTYSVPKLAFGSPLSRQEPLLSKDVADTIEALFVL